VFGPPAPKKSPLGLFNPISLRPSVALERGEVGHLEGDLIIGAANASALVTLFDRASRCLWVADLPDGYHADGTLAAVCEILDRSQTVTAASRPRHVDDHPGPTVD